MKLLAKIGCSLILISLFAGCGGSGILSVDILGNGTGQVVGSGIDCPGKCKSRITFTASDVLSQPNKEFIDKPFEVTVIADSNSELLWWLNNSENYFNGEDTCNGHTTCAGDMTLSCANYYQTLGQCTNTNVNNVNLRPIIVQKDSLIDWDKGGSSVCVLRKDGSAQCWEDRFAGEFEAATPPSFVNPKSISSFDTQACVLDETGVHCWFRGGVYSEPSVTFGLDAVESVVVADNYRVCALSNGEVTCWTGTATTTLDVPELVSPTNLRRQSGIHCVDDETGKVCWTWNNPNDLQVYRS